MIKKTNTYILNGKELSKKDLENYLVFEPNMIEENIKKVLKYDKVKGVQGDNFVKDLNSAFIINTKDGYCLYDLNGKQISKCYKYAVGFTNDSMLYINDDAYGIITDEGEKVFEVNDKHEGEKIQEIYTSKQMNAYPYNKVEKDNKIGFSKNNKKVISTSYDMGYLMNNIFVMKNGLDIYMFDETGKNLILESKISEICSNISKYFNLDLESNDLETLYELLSMKLISKKEFLYDLENNKIVNADKVIKKYKLSTEKREIIIDRTNKKVKTRKK